MHGKMIKLGSLVKEVGTGLKGMLTHYRVGIGANTAPWYCFQPQGLDPEKGIPLERIWAEEAQFAPKDDGAWVDVPEMPLGMLGQPVIDAASGFKGTVMGLVHHISGCTHAEVRAAGLSAKGKPIPLQDFDIRTLRGKSVPTFADEAALEADKKRKPSPAATPERTVAIDTDGNSMPGWFPAPL